MQRDCPIGLPSTGMMDQRSGARFRKTDGQHPNCGTCMEYKKRLRALQRPEQRAQVLEEYCQHIFLQWCDRGMDANCTELSRACRRMLDMGARLIAMARQTSFWLIRADGVDQAKFRVPAAQRRPIPSINSFALPSMCRELGAKVLGFTLRWPMHT